MYLDETWYIYIKSWNKCPVLNEKKTKKTLPPTKHNRYHSSHAQEI